MLILVFIGLPSLLLGIKGIQGRLIDGSGNRSVGVVFLGIFTAILLSTLFVFRITRGPKG